MNAKLSSWLGVAACSLLTSQLNTAMLAAPNADASGLWKWSFTAQSGQTFESKLTLKQDGGALTGVLVGRNNTEIRIDAGKISGDEISFKVTRERNGQTFTQTYLGKLSGDTIKGTISFERDGQTNTRDWEAKREAAPAKATGTWKWSVTGQSGQTRETTLKLKQEGSALTGAVIGRNNNETAIEDGKVKGNAVSFKVSRERNGVKTTQTFQGKLSGDTMKGTITTDRDGQTNSREWLAKREGAALNVAGTWKWSISLPNGSAFELSMKLTQEGDKVSGVMIRNENEIPLQRLTLKDGEISFQVTRERNGETYTTKYAGKISSEGIKGKINSNYGGEDRTFDWDAKKAAE